MKKDWVLTPESFAALLAWLHPDPNEAGKKYEDIRRRLIKVFTCRGCFDAEDLADESINRVISRVEDIAGTFTGDPALYFYGVANKVHQESIRRRPIRVPPDIIDDRDNLEEQSACLDKCMEKLTPANRQLVVQYYQEEKRAKIEHRKQLADQMGIALNALRIRAHRIRTTLQLCVQTCLQEMI